MWQSLRNLTSYCKNPLCRDGFAGWVRHTQFVMWQPSRSSMTQPGSPIRLNLPFAALMSVLCWLAFITATQSASAAAETSDLRGTVFIVDSATGRSVMPGAKVRLEGARSPLETVTDE